MRIRQEGEDGDDCIISTYICIYITRRKGPSENRQEGEDGDNRTMYMHVLYIYILFGGRGRAGAGRRGKAVTTVNCFYFVLNVMVINLNKFHGS